MWQYNFSPYLAHYVSKYYDPAKASQYNHEYYEAHKQLKGRTTGRKTLTDAGKVVNSTVKKHINEERDQALTEEDERHQKAQQLKADATKRTMEQHRLIMNQRITSIQNMIKRLPENMRHDEAPKLKAAIQRLREDNDKKRASIQSKYQTERAAASEEHKNTKKDIREKAKQAYEAEYEKIVSEYAKKKKR